MRQTDLELTDLHLELASPLVWRAAMVKVDGKLPAAHAKRQLRPAACVTSGASRRSDSCKHDPDHALDERPNAQRRDAPGAPVPSQPIGAPITLLRHVSRPALDRRR